MEKFKDLKLKVTPKQLKERGYTFQKLYAMNYKTYRKEIGDRTIWIWVKGGMIEIDDWYSNTINVINSFIENFDNPLIEGDYIKIQLNRKDCKVQLFDDELYFSSLIKSDWSEWYGKYDKKWSEIVQYKNYLPELIEELKFLTNN